MFDKVSCFSLLLLIVIGCQSNQHEINGRVYHYEPAEEKYMFVSLANQIDSLFKDKNLKKIDTNHIYLSKLDSLKIVEFKRSDSIELYLQPDYQTFLNFLTYNSNDDNIILRTTFNNELLSEYYPMDSIVYKSVERWIGPTYVDITVMPPIKKEQHKMVMKYMDTIIGYITYESDSAFTKIYLHKNNVVLEIPYKWNWKIDSNGEKYFKHTANLISDSVFYGWDTEIRLKDSSSNIIKSFKNVDTTYVLMN